LGSGGGLATLKMSGIGHLLYLGLCRTSSNRSQVVIFPADLAQFWDAVKHPLPTTPTRYDTAAHQFLVQEAIPHDVMPSEIGYLSS